MVQPLWKSFDLFIINSFRNCDAAEWSAACVILVRVSDYQHKDNNSISQACLLHLFTLIGPSVALAIIFKWAVFKTISILYYHPLGTNYSGFGFLSTVCQAQCLCFYKVVKRISLQ